MKNHLEKKHTQNTDATILTLETLETCGVMAWNFSGWEKIYGHRCELVLSGQTRGHPRAIPNPPGRPREYLQHHGHPALVVGPRVVDDVHLHSAVRGDHAAHRVEAERQWLDGAAGLSLVLLPLPRRQPGAAVGQIPSQPWTSIRRVSQFRGDSQENGRYTCEHKKF